MRIAPSVQARDTSCTSVSDVRACRKEVSGQAGGGGGGGGRKEVINV